VVRPTDFGGVVGGHTSTYQRPVRERSLDRSARRGHGCPVGAPSPRPIALIVEDDADIRDALQAVVEHAGFEAACASHGLEALRYLAGCERLPRVVLLDLMMPVMDGWQFLDKRDDRARAIPVLVLSAAHDPRVPDTVRLLRKPISIDTLLDALRPCWS